MTTGILGLVDRPRLAGMRPLAEILENFRAHVASRGTTPKHVERVVSRTDRLFSACGFQFFGDIRPETVEVVLGALRAGDPEVVERYVAAYDHTTDKRTARYRRELLADGLSVKASNHMLASARQLTRWAVTRGLAHADPLAILEPLSAKTDRLRVRRAITEDELRILIQVAHDGPARPARARGNAPARCRGLAQDRPAGHAPRERRDDDEHLRPPAPRRGAARARPARGPHADGRVRCKGDGDGRLHTVQHTGAVGSRWPREAPCWLVEPDARP
jgi:hypothetical protein